MANGFTVSERIAAPPAEVWAFLTDFANAKDWMTGVDAMTQASDGPLAVGTRFTFMARGKERESHVSALEPGRRIALTSTQAGVTATYVYSVAPDGDGTEMTLAAECHGTGLWRLLHPVIVVAMRNSDSSHLAKLKAAMARRR